MEPWLTGSLTGVHPIKAALLYSFQQAREDLARWTDGLTNESLWRRHGDVAPVAFHILHIAGSVDRLISYAENRPLSDAQMQELRSEQDNQGLSREQLLNVLDENLSRAEAVIRALDEASFEESREVGRKRLRVPLGVLLVHISEHTQRHVGAAIVTSKIARL